MKHQLIAAVVGTLCIMGALAVTAALNGQHAHWAWPLGGAAALLFLFALTTPPQK